MNQWKMALFVRQHPYKQKDMNKICTYALMQHEYKHKDAESMRRSRRRKGKWLKDNIKEQTNEKWQKKLFKDLKIYTHAHNYIHTRTHKRTHIWNLRHIATLSKVTLGLKIEGVASMLLKRETDSNHAVLFLNILDL